MKAVVVIYTRNKAGKKLLTVWVHERMTTWENRSMYEQGGRKQLSGLDGQRDGDTTNEMMNYKEEVFQETL